MPNQWEPQTPLSVPKSTLHRYTVFLALFFFLLKVAIVEFISKILLLSLSLSTTAWGYYLVFTKNSLFLQLRIFFFRRSSRELDILVQLTGGPLVNILCLLYKRELIIVFVSHGSQCISYKIKSSPHMLGEFIKKIPCLNFSENPNFHLIWE